MQDRIVTQRGYCVCCGVQRDEQGAMNHDEECMWYGSVDMDYMKDGERVIIFCPYNPFDKSKKKD